MIKTKYLDIDKLDKRERLKVRKGRLILLIALILFFATDIALFIEYKARGTEAIGYHVVEQVGAVLGSGKKVVESVLKPELAQDENDLTSVLVVGIDSRNVKFTGTEFVNTKPKNQAGTRNTDTIMQIVYDNKNKNVFMISIPRDMGVDVRKDCLTFHGSLHWVYDKGQAVDCPGGGVQTLIDTVEGITGIRIQYYAFVSLSAFTDIIDTVGDTDENGNKGIWIDNPKAVYEVYPVGETGWKSVFFPKGEQFLTPERALEFARSRKLSSDFDRAKRQQIVIEAVKDRILSSDTLFNPRKLYTLLDTFKNDVLFTYPTIEDIRAALDILKGIDETEIVHLVLDPELGGHEVLLNKQPHDRPGGPYYMVPKAWKECPGDEFCKVKDYIKGVIENPEVSQEQAKIFVYARTNGVDGKPNFNNEKYIDFKKEALAVSLTESKYIAKFDKGDITILDYSDGAKIQTLMALSQALGVDITPGSEAPNVRINKEDIAIVVKGK